MAKGTSSYYDLNNRFLTTTSVEYSQHTADDLKAWIRMEPTTPVDEGPHSLSPEYVDTDSAGRHLFDGGIKVYDTAVCDDGTPKKYVQVASPLLSFSTLGDNGESSGNTDLPFSVSVWVKLNESATNDHTVISKENAVATGVDFEYRIHLNDVDGDFQIWFQLYDGNQSSNYFSLCKAIGHGGSASFSPDEFLGRWAHLVCTYGGSAYGAAGGTSSTGAKIYLNGRALGPLTFDTGANYKGMQPDLDGPLLIGGDADSSSNTVEGFVAETAVWSKSLTQIDVTALYNGALYGAVSFRSGYTNDSPRLQLRDLDHRLGAYPTIARTGDKDYLGKGNSFFDDTMTLDYLSSYARAVIQFKELPIDGSKITLYDARGVSKTFEFVREWKNIDTYISDNRLINLTKLANLDEAQLSDHWNVGSMTHMNVGNWNPGGSPQDDPGSNHELVQDLDETSATYGQWFKSDVDTVPTPTVAWSIHHLNLTAELFADAVMKEYKADNIQLTAKAELGMGIGRVILKQTVAGTAGNWSDGNNDIVSDKAEPSEPDGDGVMEGLVQWMSSSFVGGKSVPLLGGLGVLSGSRYAENMRVSPNTLPDIITEGEVMRSSLGTGPFGDLAGKNTKFHVSDETISPFDESRIRQGGMNSVFYGNLRTSTSQQGIFNSAVDTRRFGSKLRDKTAIVIDIDPAAPTSVWYSTGSSGPSGYGNSFSTSAKGLAGGINSGLVYYNFNRKVWEAIGDFTTGSNVDVMNARADVRTGSMMAFATGPWQQPFGMNSMEQISRQFVNCARAGGLPTNYAGFPVASKFNATGSQLLDMSNYITHPFLLEKVVVEWSGSVGARPANFEDTPCVSPNQFFIMNQYQNDIQKTFSRNDVVLNIGEWTDESSNQVTQSMASFDCTQYKELVWYGRVGVYDKTDEGIDKITEKDITHTIQYMSSSKRDSCDLWIPTAGQSAPTGTFVLEKSVTTPVLSEHSVGPLPGRQATVGQNTPVSEVYFPGSAGCRDLFGTPSGRSYFRSVPSSGKILATFTPWTGDKKNVANFKISSLDRYEDTSPYLLMPTDKLVIGFANQQTPHVLNTHWDSSVSKGGNLGEWSLGVTGSLVSTLAPGRGKITLYGSHIRMGREYHSTVNQPLTSLAIHEALHSDNPVLDQFMVEPTLIYSGGYLDQIVAGTIPSYTTVSGPNTPGVFNDSAVSGQSHPDADSNSPSTYNRAVVSSAIAGTAGITGSMSRFRRYVDNNERYLDSMPGSPGDYHITNGFSLLSAYGGTVDAGKAGLLAVGPPHITGSQILDNLWSRAFPFEPKYKHIQRLRGISDFDKKLPATNLKGDVAHQPVPMRYMLVLVNDITIVSVDSKFDVQAPGVAHKMMKFYFGIGDKTNKTGTWVENHNQRGELANTVGGLLNADVNIRGWKYGLINANAQRSSLVFRPDRFGQFRDLLEIRPFARYFSEADGEQLSAVEILFVERDTHAPVPDPEMTNSQNMSIYATSSQPFYDEPAFTWSPAGIITNLGHMRSSTPPDMEPPIDIETSATEAVEDVTGG